MRTLVPVLLALCLLLPLAGCASRSRPVDMEPHAPDKDVLIYLVKLNQPMTPRQYMEFAQQDLARVGSEPINPEFPAQPVYELFYSFHADAEPLATVHYRRVQNGPDDPGTLTHIGTRVYPTEEQPR